MKTGKYDIAVIGAGPAGMMAAIRASECGAEVVMLERNTAPGAKLLMTGKERCNITNSERDPKSFALNFGKNGKFLLGALYHFGTEETIGFFNRNGLRTKTERGGRVFPESDKAKDVRELFVALIKKSGVSLVPGAVVKSLPLKGGLVEKIVLESGNEIRADNYIICTGGCSYPATGSTGDGYRWAKQLGHTIVKPLPALTPVLVKEKWVSELEGLSLRNVRISVYQDSRKKGERFGEAVFTCNGLSGPIVLDMSKSIGKLLESGEVLLLIDFKPALDYTLLDKRVLRDIGESGNKTVKNMLAGLLPKKMIPVMLRSLEMPHDRKSHSITRQERRRLLHLLKRFPFTAKGLLGFNKAIITSGGIDLKEVDSGTMRSRIIDNLYFAGEILDLDGPTGGYNLQVCWSTGYLAGESAAGSVLSV